MLTIILIVGYLGTLFQPELAGGVQSPEDGGRPLTDGHVTLSTSMLDARPQAIVHMPHASVWPFLLTVALLATAGCTQTFYAAYPEATEATVTDFLAFSPEREDPGNEAFGTATIPRPPK